ncbi:hypothetical protein ANTRET_LOCUS10116 [Anthophora retusa]
MTLVLTIKLTGETTPFKRIRGISISSIDSTVPISNNEISQESSGVSQRVESKHLTKQLSPECQNMLPPTTTCHTAGNGVAATPVVSRYTGAVAPASLIPSLHSFHPPRRSSLETVSSLGVVRNHLETVHSQLSPSLSSKQFSPCVQSIPLNKKKKEKKIIHLFLLGGNDLARRCRSWRVGRESQRWSGSGSGGSGGNGSRDNNNNSSNRSEKRAERGCWYSLEEEIRLPSASYSFYPSYSWWWSP